MIYLDNASTSKVSRTVIDAMLPYLDIFYANPSSPHSMGMVSAKALNNARNSISDSLGASPDEIIFTSGGSEANAQAIFTAAEFGRRIGKKRIISTKIEHESVYKPLEHLKSNGFDVVFADVDKDGFVSVENIARLITDDTFFVSVMTANNEIGTIQPIAEIGHLCRKNGILFHTDAVQSVGHIPTDVNELCVDILSLSAHKFGGTKGAGALYVRNGIDAKPIILGGSQENGLRAGTENIPAIVAMQTALRESLENLPEKNLYIEKLRNRLIEQLSDIPDTILNGGMDNRLSGNVNISFKNINADALLMMLDQAGICASKGSACKSNEETPSRVMMAICREPEYALGTVRFTLSHENTSQEIDFVAKTVEDAVGKLRK